MSQSHVQTATASVLCKQSIFASLIATLICLPGAVAMVLWYFFWNGPGIFAWASAPLLGLVGLLALTQTRRILSSENWILALFPDGMAIKLKSYLNHDSGIDDVVLYLDKEDVLNIQSIRQNTILPGQTATTIRNALAIQTRDDLAPVRIRLMDIRKQKEDNGQIHFNHYPVEVADDHLLMVNWMSKYDSIRPKLNRILTVLAQQYPVGQAMHIEENMSDVETDEAQIKASIVSLEQRGEYLAALDLARQSLNLNTTQASKLIKELKSQMNDEAS